MHAPGGNSTAHCRIIHCQPPDTARRASKSNGCLADYFRRGPSEGGYQSKWTLVSVFLKRSRLSATEAPQEGVPRCARGAWYWDQPSQTSPPRNRPQMLLQRTPSCCCRKSLLYVGERMFGFRYSHGARAALIAPSMGHGPIYGLWARDPRLS